MPGVVVEEMIRMTKDGKFPGYNEEITKEVMEKRADLCPPDDELAVVAASPNEDLQQWFRFGWRKGSSLPLEFNRTSVLHLILLRKKHPEIPEWLQKNSLLGGTPPKIPDWFHLGSFDGTQFRQTKPLPTPVYVVGNPTPVHIAGKPPWTWWVSLIVGVVGILTGGVAAFLINRWIH
jgi:hypothetical protein